jgi:hypothetical protein
MGLDFPTSVSFERLQAPFESASDALARFDERLRSSPVADGAVYQLRMTVSGFLALSVPYWELSLL